MSLNRYVRQLNPIKKIKSTMLVKCKNLLRHKSEFRYSFFPNFRGRNIKHTKRSKSKRKCKRYINLFNFLKCKDKTPINIDLKKPKDINVSRGIKDVF